MLTEIDIHRLFGHEDADLETVDRLQEYYFKSSVYAQMKLDLPLRILVGHKGTGKSALFRIGLHEDNEVGKLSILIRPNDITKLAVDSDDFLLMIRNWTEGLTSIIIEKVFDLLGIDSANYRYDYNTHRGKIIKFLSETFLKLEQKGSAPNKESAILRFLENPKLYVYIDDLDRGWKGRKDDIARISALLNSIKDINIENREINFKVALRSDVYYLVRTSDESTDKIEGAVIWHSWTNHEIFVMLIKRIETYFGRTVNEAELLQTEQSELSNYLNPIMEPRFRGRGHWSNIPTYRMLMSLIRKRPRDLVKLCTLAATHATTRKASLISTEDFDAIFANYSTGRIQDTINEFRSELPLIEPLLLNMKPNKKERQAKLGYVYKIADLYRKLYNVSQLQSFRFADGKSTTPQTLAAFLYKINFLTARRETPTGIERKYFEDNQYLLSNDAEFGFDFEIHPAYRWALQPNDLESIFNELEISA